MGLKCKKQKKEGAWVKKKLKLILPKIKSKHLNTNFFSNFQDIHFLFHDCLFEQCIKSYFEFPKTSI
jgi:hypothetical protein